MASRWIGRPDAFQHMGSIMGFRAKEEMDLDLDLDDGD
jgi:hypothetical protein